MAYDAVDHARLCNKGDDAHASAAGAQKGVGLENFPYQPCPGAAGLPGAIRIVPLRMLLCRQAGGLAMRGRQGNPSAVGIRSIESLTMFSRIRDMRRDAVDAFERTQHDRGGAGPWIGRRFHNQSAVVKLPERIHGQCRARDIPGLGFHGRDVGGIDPRAGIDGESRMDP